MQIPEVSVIRFTYWSHPYNIVVVELVLSREKIENDCSPLVRVSRVVCPVPNRIRSTRPPLPLSPPSRLPQPHASRSQIHAFVDPYHARNSLKRVRCTLFTTLKLANIPMKTDYLVKRTFASACGKQTLGILQPSGLLLASQFVQQHTLSTS